MTRAEMTIFSTCDLRFAWVGTARCAAVVTRKMALKASLYGDFQGPVVAWSQRLFMF